MKPILIVYHCLFVLGDPPEILPRAIDIVHEQMGALKTSGLLDAASQMIVGCNGGMESYVFCDSLLPDKCKPNLVMHGTQCRNEIRTWLELEKWVRDHPDWLVLYHHSKNASHSDLSGGHASLGERWRRCMTNTCVVRWRECVKELELGTEAVGAHWLTGMGHDHSQHYFAGTFFWATSNFLRTLPSIMVRDRLKTSGVDSVESRYEVEVAIGNGPRLPRIKDMETSHGFAGCP